MNTQLQKIIEEIEDEYLQAEQQEKHSMMINSEMHLWYEGYKLACKLHAERLTKILNEGSVAASSKVHFQVDFKAGTITKTRGD